VKLATWRLRGDGEPIAGEVRDGRAIAFDDGSTVAQRLATGADAGGPADGRDWDLEELELLAPIPRPRATFCIGLNYSDHAAEQGLPAPEFPIVFLKLPSSAAPPFAPVRCPAVVRRLDYEGELVVVIGAGGAPGGYCVADDVSARDLQKREPQWTRAKGADGFCPYGPWITTADEIDDPGALALRTWVNGELRQDASTANMIFGVARLIEFIGETCTLEPGDLILTGTPAGVGMSMDPPQFLQAGDRVRIEIEQLGAIEHELA
jgi:acylpyruvate hydrolase